MLLKNHSDKFHNPGIFPVDDPTKKTFTGFQATKQSYYQLVNLITLGVKNAPIGSTPFLN